MRDPQRSVDEVRTFPIGLIGIVEVVKVLRVRLSGMRMYEIASNASRESSNASWWNGDSWTYVGVVKIGRM